VQANVQLAANARIAGKRLNRFFVVNGTAKTGSGEFVCYSSAVEKKLEKK
jgi:hypothetical protein